MRQIVLTSFPLLSLCVGCFPDLPPPADTDTLTDTGSTDAVNPSGPTTTGSEEPTSTSPPDPAETGTSLENCEALRKAAAGVLTEHCVACHGEAPGQGGLNDITDFEDRIEDGTLVEGEPDQSEIYSRMKQLEMPPGGPFVPEPEQALLAAFISECTTPPGGDPLAPPKCGQTNPPITAVGLVDLIKDDLSDNVEAQDQRFTRYISFAHLHNAGLCPEQIKAYRQALSKLVNSLSRENLIRIPVPVPGSSESVFRIDIRDYGWTAELWESIVCQDPFAIEYIDDGLMTNAASVKQDTETSVFVVTGDWFISQTARPPLYHEILAIPKTLAELEAELGVDIGAEIEFEKVNDKDDVALAGLFKSGVAFFNRVIARFSISAVRYLWFSFDFDSNNGTSDIKDHPVDFQQAGGEIIISLENGMQAYMIVKANGQRLDDAPSNIVTDNENNGEVVTNGLSCFGCHARGLRVATGALRAHILSSKFDYTPDVFAAALNLYPAEEAISSLQATDKARFLSALAAADTPHLIEIGGGEQVEPIRLIHNAFVSDLDLVEVAAALGVPTDQVLMLQDDPVFSDFSKLKNQGTITRDEFELLFAPAVVKLQLGAAQPLASCTPG